MKTFFTSDLHMSHRNIIKYENRPFKTVYEMNEEMIKRWNKKVTNKDRVFILGDFIFANEHISLDHLNRLNGQLFMIRGNHDSFLKSKKVYQKFQWVKDYYRMKLGEKDIIMCHYPFNVWDKSHYGSINLFGHVHSMRSSNHPMSKPKENQYNVGADINNFEPCTLDEIIKNNEIWRKEIWD